MQPRSYHNALDERLAEIRQENRDALPWAIAWGYWCSDPKRLEKKWLSQKLLEDAIEHAIPDVERELRGIFRSLTKRFRSRRLARNILEAVLEHSRL